MTTERPLYRRIAARWVGRLLTLVVHVITAVRADWRGCEPSGKQRIYFSNHTSNADMPVIWTALPPRYRRNTRPVAAADYWLKTPLRAFAGGEVFHAVLIDRRPEARAEGDDPIQTIVNALDEGYSLIIFPEGGRNQSKDPLLPFKAGLFNIARARPHVEMVPVWVENLNNIMPKGEVIPLPLICTATFGGPIYLAPGEELGGFLTRASAALLATRPNAPAPETRDPVQEITE